MKITVTRSGGFAGLTDVVVNLDTGSLGKGEAQRVEQLVKEAKFFELPAIIDSESVGADFFRYDMTVTDGQRQHSVAFLDDNTAAVAPLRRLVDKLAH